MKYIEHNSEYIDVSTMRDKKERHIVKKSTYGTAPFFSYISSFCRAAQPSSPVRILMALVSS